MSSRLLEILGRAITVDTADLILHWLDACKPNTSTNTSIPKQSLNRIIELCCSNPENTTDAQEQLKLYLFENPDCLLGRMAAASIYLRENLIKDAICELNSVYMRQPSNTMALYALGHCYERCGMEAEATAFYQDCLKFKNHLLLPRQRLSAIYFKNGQLEKTIQEYELLRNEYPDDIPSLVTLGYLYIAAGQHTKAIETFDTSILIHPDNFVTEDAKIDHLIRNGQLHEALSEIQDLLQDQPERADLVAKQADILSMLGASPEAICRYEEAIRISPNFLEATVKLGTQYAQMHDEQLAAAYYNKALELNEQIVDSYVGLALAQKLMANIPNSLAALSLAAAINANSALLLAHASLLYYKANLHLQPSPNTSQDDLNTLLDDLIKTYRDQLTQHPQNPDLHYRFGILMTSFGRLNDALTSFQQASRINPTYSRARTKLALCLLEKGHKAAALEQLTPPECLDKQTLALYYKTALLFSNKSRFATSITNLHRQLGKTYTTIEAEANICLVLQNLGLLDRATVMWQNITDTTNKVLHPHTEPPLEL